MTVFEKKKFHKYDDETLKKLQGLLLMILEEFIRICEENDIEYMLDGGTALGAVRHQGFIPWDDDVDVIMLRDQYEKFLDVMKDYESDKFVLFNSQNNEYYCRNYSELTLKGTEVLRFYGSEKTDFTPGISVEIFPLDNFPEGYFNEKLLKFKFKLYEKLLMMYEVTFNDMYISKNKEKVGRIIGKIFKLLGINNKFVKNRWNALINKCKKANPDTICSLCTVYFIKRFPRSMFTPTKKAKFEHLEVNIPNDYDGYLSTFYGDYMKLPPVEDRVNHNFTYIDFGDY